MLPTLESDNKLIGMPEVMELTALRKSYIYELIQRKKLRPVKIGRRTLFVKTDIIGFLNERIAANL